MGAKSRGDAIRFFCGFIDNERVAGSIFGSSKRTALWKRKYASGHSG
ncbi:hypothetical protein SM11_pC1446 (plasmid) [Sinorhizobium meliloti SM11]|uniref:Uncharacterized protein n=1 Tax=Sinorhizobium meliloti (strain SM11) TaxID=707241 RepID=F7XBK1_SINMM|nr:hypothetical protein SM11_pC1446 [Sinorhizobium meliloti SM11]